jgi:hypothetical protein
VPRVYNFEVLLSRLSFAGLALTVTGLAAEIDLTNATVAMPVTASVREKKALMMLLDEVEKRTQIRWSVAAQPAGTFIRIG